MKMIKKAVGLILAMLLAFPPNVIAETVGTISYIEGRVDRLAKDGKSYLPVAAGEQVSTGDVLRTKSSSKAEITFTDKSVVRMSDGTQIKVSDYLVGQDGYRKNAVIDLERGNVRAIVSKTLDLAPFNINTPNMTGAVKGSDVFVSYQQSSTNILVAEGLFNVKNPSFPDQAIAIKNGMAAMVPYNKPPEEPRTFMDIEKQKYEAVTGPSIRIEGKSKNLEVVRATIIKIEGSTRVQSKGANKWHIPAIGEVLYMGDIVETADKSKVRLAFDNGLSMELQPSTQLLITSLTRNIKTGDYDTSFESKYGKIIAKLQNKPKNSTFVVKTPHAACGIRGTIMYLSIMPDLTRVFFQGGTGNVHSILKNLEKVALEGKVLIIDKDGNIIEQDMTPEDLAGFDSQFGNEGQNEYGYSGGDGVNYGITSIIQNSGFPNPGDLGTDPFDDVKPEPNAEDQDGDGNPDNVPTNLVTSNFEGKYGYYGSFEIDEASVISGNITTTTYVPWGGENQVAVFEGTYDNPNGQSLFFGSVTGSGADGGALVGRFLGANESVYESTSWQGVLSAIYIDSTGSTGLVSGPFVGSYSYISADSIVTQTVSGLGALSYIYKGTTTMSPEDLAGSLVMSTDEHLRDIVIDNGAGSLSGRETRNTINIDGASWGIWENISRSTYERPEGLVSGGTFVATYGQGDSVSGYTYTTYIGKDTYSDPSVGGFLQIEEGGRTITYYGLSTFYGYEFGAYAWDGTNYYEGVGAGIWENETFGWSAEVDTYYHNYSSENGYVLAGLYNSAIMGAVTSPFDNPGEAVAVTLMGETDPSNGLVWWGNLLGSKAGDGSVLTDGFIAGQTSVASGETFGKLVALYVDANGNAGLLRGYVDGEYYSDVNMWMADGSVTAEQKNTDCCTRMPEGMNYLDGQICDGAFEVEGTSAGDISTGNSIYNMSYGQLMSYTAWIDRGGYTRDELGWGIFNIEMGGYYGYEGITPDTWSMNLYGNNWGQLASFWVGTVTGTKWSDNLLYGTFEGIGGMDVKNLLVANGDIFGSYDVSGKGIWEAVVVGTYEEVPLTFVSSVNAYNYDGYMSYYGSTPYIDWNELGEIDFLIGSTDSLWTGSNTNVVLMGRYYEETSGYGSFLDYFYSANYTDETYTTYDGGAYNGYIVGTFDGDLNGQVMTIYVDPNGNAGYMYGDFASVCSLDDSFYGEGAFYLHEMPNVGITADVLDSSLNDATSEYVGYDMRTYGDNGSIDIYGIGEMYTSYLVNYDLGMSADWGIYAQWLICDGGADMADISSISAAIGGQADFGVLFSNVEGSLSMEDYDIGWWIADVNYVIDGNEIEGDVDGDFISYTKMGTLTGDIFGISDEDGEWQAVGTGYWVGKSLSHAATISSSSVNDEYSVTTDIKGIMGGVDSLWDAGTADVMLMGDYATSEQATLWMSRADSVKWDSGEGWMTGTYDGGWYKGFMLGAQEDSDIAGFMIAVGEDPAGNVGFVIGSFGGDVYSINQYYDSMFRMDGTLMMLSYSDLEGLDLDTVIQYFEEGGEGDTTIQLFEDFNESFGNYKWMDDVEVDMVIGAGIVSSADLTDFAAGDMTISELMASEPFAAGVMIGPALVVDGNDRGTWGAAFLMVSNGISLTDLSIQYVGAIVNAGLLDMAGTVLGEGFNMGVDDVVYYMGVADNFGACENEFTADFNGVWIQPDTNTIYLGEMNGEIVGKTGYVELGESEEIGTGFVGAGAGEWVEVAELTDLSDLTSEMQSIIGEDFALVTIPITDMAASSCYGGITGANISDMTLYATSADALTGVWAALITGSYNQADTIVQNNWGANFNGGDLDLDGLTWADGKWTATVSGDLASGQSVAGTAAGTYGDGSFTGVGAGVWENTNVADGINQVIPSGN